MSGPTDFMARAIEIARTAMLENGAAPFGAVVVRDGEIVGEGVNNVVNHHDPTSHGEVEAIRDAGRRTGSWDLSGCELYTSCEPCEMCVAAMYWARIDRFYYAATLTDCGEIGLDTAPLTAMVRADLHDRALPAAQLLPAEGRDVLQLWSRQPGFDTFQSPPGPALQSVCLCAPCRSPIIPAPGRPTPAAPEFPRDHRP